MVLDSLRRIFSVLLRQDKDAEKQVRLLTTLNEIAQQLTSTLELETLLQYIVENAVKILDCEAGSLFLVDEQSHKLVLKVANGVVAADLLGQRLAPGKGIAGYAAQMRQPLIENDVQHSDLYQNHLDQKTGFVTRSLMVVPMQVKNHVVGLLEVINHQNGLPFTANDQSLLVAFAGQAAVAIENARLFQATQANEERVRELNITLEKRVEERTLQLHNEKTRIEQFAQDVQCLRALTNFLQVCLTIDEAGGIISDHMSSLFPFTSGSLFLATEGSSELLTLTHWGSASIADELDPVSCWGLRRSRAYIRQAHDSSPRCSHYRNDLPEESICLPLLVQGEVIGLIYIEIPLQENKVSLTPEMQNLAIASADSIALALANLRLKEKLHDQAIRDPLTGLFNRRHLDETLSRETHRANRSQKPLCVIMFEVDDFKRYNNTFGHDAGDYVLRKVADTMISNLRYSDFPCRYGGDEFTLLLPETTLEDGANRAEELRKSVEMLVLSYHNQALGQVTVRMGVAAYPKHGDTGEAVRKIADDASYRARAIGKNCVVVAE